MKRYKKMDEGMWTRSTIQLAVDAAVFDEAAGRALLQLDGAAPLLAAVGAGFVAVVLARRHCYNNACANIEYNRASFVRGRSAEVGYHLT